MRWSGIDLAFAVDEGERGCLARWLERLDDFVARIPDHHPLVKEATERDRRNEVLVADSGNTEHTTTVSEDTLLEAWEDQQFFLLAARKKQ